MSRPGEFEIKFKPKPVHPKKKNKRRLLIVVSTICILIIASLAIFFSLYREPQNILGAHNPVRTNSFTLGEISTYRLLSIDGFDHESFLMGTPTTGNVNWTNLPDDQYAIVTSQSNTTNQVIDFNYTLDLDAYYSANITEQRILSFEISILFRTTGSYSGFNGTIQLFNHANNTWVVLLNSTNGWTIGKRTCVLTRDFHDLYSPLAPHTLVLRYFLVNHVSFPFTVDTDKIETRMETRDALNVSLAQQFSPTSHSLSFVNIEVAARSLDVFSSSILAVSINEDDNNMPGPSLQTKYYEYLEYGVGSLSVPFSLSLDTTKKYWIVMHFYNFFYEYISFNVDRLDHYKDGFLMYRNQNFGWLNKTGFDLTFFTYYFI